MKLLIGQEKSDGAYYTIPEKDVLLAIELVKEQHRVDSCHGGMTMRRHDELMEEINVYEGLLELIRIHYTTHTKETKHD